MNWKSLPIPPETLNAEHAVSARGQGNSGTVAFLSGVVVDMETANRGTNTFPQVTLTVTFDHGDFKSRNALISELKKLLDNYYK